MIYYSGLVMGILGSMHCLGMCGPVVFALPVRTKNPWLKFFKYLVYNTGRVTMYGVFGLTAGMLGQGFELMGLQQVICLLTGLLMVASVFVFHARWKNKFFDRYTGRLRKQLSEGFKFFFQRKGLTPLFILGILNGLLPCGMVYLALISALAIGNHVSSFLFMVSFGAGTVPMMLSVGILGNVVNEKVKVLFLKARPVLACLIGVLLIMRGLNVHVPYLYPQHSCCQVHAIH